MSHQHFEIAVLGSGFAGSLMAMIARRLGFSTILIERGKHPRFAIGESSTPLANLLLEEIAVEHDLPFIRPLSKWGRWQKELPKLGCGLKRGFTFYHHEFGKPFAPDPHRKRQLLVGASPNEEIADTHWYRPDFDHYLAQQAQNLGVSYLDETELVGVSEETNGIGFAGRRCGETLEFTAEFVIDATGPRGFLFRKLKLPENKLESLPRTHALFSHFRNVGPLPDSFSNRERPPYPPEQAAVHHVFDGGWVWVLKFNNGITSAGVAATDALANELQFRSGEDAWRRLLKRLPSLAEMFESATVVIPFVHLPRVAFRCAKMNGDHWALLPSAAGFVDPLLSTGFPLTLLGIQRIAGILRSHREGSSLRSALADYATLTMQELDVTTLLVDALYATMHRFDLFRQLSLLYFAAASFCEAARRLGKSALAESFLLCRNREFAGQLRNICESAKEATSSAADIETRIHRAIEPFDVAGLTDRSRNNWHPALVEDVVQGRGKLRASEHEVVAMLKKCGLVGR